MENLTGAELNPVKERLAFELTRMVHGEDEAQKALETARQVFSSAANSEDMPTTVLTEDDFENGEIGILALLVKCGLAPSNGEARRLVQQGGISVDGEKVADPKYMVKIDDFVVIKKGKKVFHKASK